MDEYMFNKNVRSCDVYEEKTQYLEISCYTDAKLNTIKENELTCHDFEDFLYRRGAFTPQKVPPNVSLASELRLVLQKNPTHLDTFSPNVLSLQPEAYIWMIKTFNLPFRAIEITSCLGPLYWSLFNPNDGNPILQIIFRKADVRKKRGWEVLLCYEIKTGTTTGFYKGNIGSDIVECLNLLKACATETIHPMILPILIFSQHTSFKTDSKQQEARSWLRRIEHAVRARSKIEPDSYYAKRGILDLDVINIDLVECHAQVLWKSSVSYLQMVEAFKETMEMLREAVPEERWADRTMQKIHFSLLSRLEFYKRKLLGIDNYAQTGLKRLEIQRGVVNGLLAQRENKLNFEMAQVQQRIALASKRDASTMKTLSVLGIVFLPGTFLASILSTTFFDFYGAPTLATSVSPRFWVFWVVDIPITLAILGVWYVWERKQAKPSSIEGIDPEMEVRSKW